jgi:hypothetical protein
MNIYQIKYQIKLLYVVCSNFLFGILKEGVHEVIKLGDTELHRIFVLNIHQLEKIFQANITNFKDR